MYENLLLVLLFLLTIGHLVTLKLCSLKLDHRTAPVFIGGWTLFGLATVSPVYGALWHEGWGKFMAAPHLLALAVLKGVLLYYLFIVSQELMKVSLSSRHYVTPLSIGLLTLANYFLGENLTPVQLFSCLGLCLLSLGFFFKGHLSEMDRSAKRSYFMLVVLSAFIGALDQAVIRETNWYIALGVSMGVLFILALAVTHDRAVLRAAFLSRAAILAGFFYMATELVKFYQMVSINPITVVVTVQAMTKPVILVLSAMIWKERTVREQIVWGALAFAITLPLFFAKG